jgi:hypothetical protein
METPANHPTGPAVRPDISGPPAYEPPRLTGKQALEKVTLFSGGGTGPGGPGWIGHP